MKMRIITLLQTSMIAGLPRSPAEGAQTVPAAEAKHLVDHGMAEYADGIDAGDDAEEGDDLGKKTVKQLQALAKKEDATVPAGADKDALIAAIRAKRAQTLSADDLDGKSVEDLREIAKAEAVEVAEDADEEALRVAIREKRNPTA